MRGHHRRLDGSWVASPTSFLLSVAVLLMPVVAPSALAQMPRQDLRTEGSQSPAIESSRNAGVTYGYCSPIVGDPSRSTITITCNGISQEEAENIKQILNLILQVGQNGKDGNEILADIRAHLKNIDNRGATSYNTPYQILSNREGICNRDGDEIRSRIASTDLNLPKSDIDQLDHFDESFFISLQSSIRADQLSSIEALRGAHRNFDATLYDYAIASSSLQGARLSLDTVEETTPKSLPSNVRNDMVEQYQQLLAGAKSKYQRVSRMTIEAFNSLCAQISALKAACLASQCGK
jgi:hypothetical protein